MPGLEVSVKTNLASLADGLSRMQRKQLPFATSKALNTTAYEGMLAARGEMHSVFKRPTPWIIRQIGYSKSTKRNLSALVGFIQATYNNRLEYTGVELTNHSRGAHIIEPHLEGGYRGPMGIELQMRRKGILAQDEFLVPGKDMPLNRYGNVTMGWYNKMMSGLNAQADKWSNSTYSDASGRQGKSRSGNWRRWFIERVNGRKVIFYRKSKHVLMIAFIVVKRPSYKKRFDLSRTVNKVVARRFNRHFAKAMDDAMRTAW